VINPWVHQPCVLAAYHIKNGNTINNGGWAGILMKKFVVAYRKVLSNHTINNGGWARILMKKFVVAYRKVLSNHTHQEIYQALC